MALDQARAKGRTPMSEQRLVLHCGGPNSNHRQIGFIKKCRQSLLIPFGFGIEALTIALAKGGWIVSQVTASDSGERVYDILCPKCGKTVYGEQYSQAISAMEKMVSTAS